MEVRCFPLKKGKHDMDRQAGRQRKAVWYVVLCVIVYIGLGYFPAQEFFYFVCLICLILCLISISSFRLPCFEVCNIVVTTDLFRLLPRKHE